jgi:hypothetical protein
MRHIDVGSRRREVCRWTPRRNIRTPLKTTGLSSYQAVKERAENGSLNEVVIIHAWYQEKGSITWEH